MQLPPQWRWKLDRWKEQLRALFAADKEEDRRPRICPACGSLVGINATRCHECGTSMTFSMAAVGKSFGSFLPEESPVTYFMLTVNFMLFMVTLVASAQGGGFSLLDWVSGHVLYRLGARESISIFYGHEWWRLVIPIFLHGGLIHIALNMMWLKDFGPMIEDIYGSARFLFLYMVTGIIGFVWSTAWDVLITHQASGIGIGASGSMMGLLGLALAITTRRGGAYMQMMRGQFIRSAVFIVVIGLIVPGIDNTAHIGGFVSGFVFGKFFNDRLPENGPERKRAYLLGWIGALSIVASFGAAIFKFYTTQPTP